MTRLHVPEHPYLTRARAHVFLAVRRRFAFRAHPDVAHNGASAPVCRNAGGPGRSSRRRGSWFYPIAAALAAGVAVLSMPAAAAAATPPPVERNVMDYGAVGDGVTDDSRAIQRCLDDGYDGKWHQSIRVLFPAGRTFRVTHQLIAWAGVHLETDPADPATVLLPADTPGFGDPRRRRAVIMSRLTCLRPDHAHLYEEDIYRTYYVGPRKPLPGWPWKWPEEYDSAKHDSHVVMPTTGPGNNFFSQIRNLRFQSEPGNSGAVMVHWSNAQGSALQGLRFDLADDTFCALQGGPQIIECEIRGGRYGLYDTQELGNVFNTRFVGQKEAAYFAPAGGSRLMVGARFEDCPVALKFVRPHRLTMVECEIRNAGVGVEFPDDRVVYLQNLTAVDTPIVLRSPRWMLTGTARGITRVPRFAQGAVFADGQWEPDGLAESRDRLPTWNSVAAFADLATAANVRDFGAVGDDKADDTEALRKAVAAHDTVYLPPGRYRVTDTILLRPQTRLIGAHTLATHVVLAPGTSAFTDAHAKRPILDTPDDPDAEVHIAQLSVRGWPEAGHGGNVGAIALRWRVGRKSSVSSAKFNASASVLVTGHGGGTFFNVWTADAGLTEGLVVDRNREPLIFYALSSEHQTDKAVRLIGARDVVFYAGGFGEGEYPNDLAMNDIVDSDRIAMILATTHPTGTDEHTRRMTAFRIANTPNVLIAPLYRIHNEPMRSTVYDTRPDGRVVDLGNRGFTEYRWGRIGERPRDGPVGTEAPAAPFASDAAPAGSAPTEQFAKLWDYARIQAVPPVFALTVRLEGRDARLHWETPGHPFVRRVRVARKWDGYPVSPADGELIYEGRAAHADDRLPEERSVAYYAVFVEDLEGRLSRGMTASVSGPPLDDAASSPAEGAEWRRVEPDALARGLRHYWDFSSATADEASGIVAADAVGAAAGIPRDGAALAPAPHALPGRTSLALACPKGVASAGLAVSATEVAPVKGSFTLSGWFAGERDDAGRILANYPGGNFQPGIIHFAAGRFEGADQTGRGFQVIGGGRLAPGQWNHVTATLTPTEARVYFNGDLVARRELTYTTDSVWFDSKLPLIIGGSNAKSEPGPEAGEPAPGRYVNRVRVYERALSAAEVRALFWSEVEFF